MDLAAVRTAGSTTTALQDRQAEIVSRMKNERRQSTPARSEYKWWRYFAVYVLKTLAGTPVPAYYLELIDPRCFFAKPRYLDTPILPAGYFDILEYQYC